MTPEEQLDEWADEYDLDPTPITFEGFRALGERMGVTNLYSDRSARIFLHSKLEKDECAI